MQNTNLTKKVEHYKTEKFISTYKNGKEILRCWDIEIEKTIFLSKQDSYF